MCYKKKLSRIALLSIAILCNLLSIAAQAQPTASYKTNIDLLQKERKQLRSDAYFYALLPLPIPIVSNLYSGIAAWKKLKKCNTVYKYYKSAKILVEAQENPSLYPQNTQDKASRRLTKMLESIKEEALKEANQRSHLVLPSKEQKHLNKQLRRLTVLDLAQLLERANQSIPPCCGSAQTGISQYDAYNLRYRIRTISRKDPSKSIFADEVEKEEAKMFKLTR